MSWPLCFLLFSFSAFSQVELEEIEVEATKDIERFTFTTSHVIDTKTLENQPMGLVSPALANIPGLVPSQNGGPGGRISFFLRGTESRHVSFTLDGLKVNDTSNTDRQFDAAFITSPFMKEVVVHKGPQAVLYGSDAMGGMVEMKTRRGENAPETRLNVNGGSFGTIASSLSKDWKNENNNGTLTASRFHTDGISRLNEKRFDADEADATDITQLTSSSEHRWAPKFQTDLLGSYLHGKAEQDGFDDDNSFDHGRNDQYVLQQKTNYELDKSQALSLRNGFNRHQRLNNSLAAGKEFFNGNLFQHELIHRLEAGSTGLLTGIATEHETASLSNLDESFDLHSAFLQGSFVVQKLKFQAGGRADKHTKYGSFYTGSGGISFEHFNVQYSQGFKAPSLYQLYGPDSFGSPVGNQDLVPETNHSLEASWKKSTEEYDAGVAVFQNRLSNLVTFAFGRGYFNQQRFISEGVELEGKWKREAFEVSSSFTHQQFKEEDTTVLRRPYNIAHLGVSYFPEETVEVNITGRWFSSRKDIGNTEIVKLNPYEVLDFGIAKTWENDDLSFQLKNVLNREYEELYGFSVLPRSVFVNYGHRFQ